MKASNPCQFFLPCFMKVCTKQEDDKFCKHVLRVGEELGMKEHKFVLIRKELENTQKNHVGTLLFPTLNSGKNSNEKFCELANTQKES